MLRCEGPGPGPRGWEEGVREAPSPRQVHRERGSHCHLPQKRGDQETHRAFDCPGNSSDLLPAGVVFRLLFKQCVP